MSPRGTVPLAVRVLAAPANFRAMCDVSTAMTNFPATECSVVPELMTVLIFMHVRTSCQYNIDPGQVKLTGRIHHLRMFTAYTRCSVRQDDLDVEALHSLRCAESECLGGCKCSPTQTCAHVTRARRPRHKYAQGHRTGPIRDQAAVLLLHTTCTCMGAIHPNGTYQHFMND